MGKMVRMSLTLKVPGASEDEIEKGLSACAATGDAATAASRG
jgi:hypothetical protein